MYSRFEHDTVVTEAQIPWVDAKLARQHQAHGKARALRFTRLHLADGGFGDAAGTGQIADAKTALVPQSAQSLPKRLPHASQYTEPPSY